MKLNKSSHKPIRLFLTGFAMGTADLIPGVSGGTIAFISGIYEDLLNSIKTVSGETLKLFLKGKIKKSIASIPFRFLIPLVLGLFTAVLTLARVLSFLLKNFPVFIWAFFFGLVIASTWLIVKRIKSWKRVHVGVFLGFMAVGYVLVGAVPVETPRTLLAFFLSGALAICAMILPGISGSFILLILGKYTQVLEAVSNTDILPIAMVATGAVFGLALFSRFLSWLFEHHHDMAIAGLAGFMLGSVRKIWPWKEVVLTRVNSHGEIVPLVEKNLFPSVGGELSIAILLMFAGFVVITILDRYQETKQVK